MRLLVVGAFSPSPSGHRFSLTEKALSEQLGRMGRGLSLTVQDRIGEGDASSYELSFESLRDFELSAVIDAIPDLRALRRLHGAITGTQAPHAAEATRPESDLSRGRLAAAMAEALRKAHSPQDARRATLGVLEEALFITARDLLRHPVVARLEAGWRGLSWLWAHAPASPDLDLEVLDVEPAQRVDALKRCLDVSPMQRPDACFLLDPCDELETLYRLAALGEAAWLPMVIAGPSELLGAARADEGKAPAPPEAWSRLRADEASRWLCAALNPVVMASEQQGSVRRECFASPALAVAALLAASYRDTRTFARLVGPGSGTRAPGVWQPQGRSTVATEAGISLREQQRLAGLGLLGVGGFWDSDAVQLAAAPTVYGGRDAAPLPAQLLTGRIVRLVQELAERLPASAGDDAVAALFSRAAEVCFPSSSGRACQLQARVVRTGPGGRGVHVRATLRPELAGTPLQLELTLPLRT
jgi:hypothetical protein